MNQTNTECYECGGTDAQRPGLPCDACMERAIPGWLRLRDDHERLLAAGVHPDIASRRLCVAVEHGDYD